MGTDLSDLLERVEWVPHIVKDGARFHTPAFGVLEDAGRLTTVCWCSEPLCESNRWEVERLIRDDWDVLSAQPPPRLRATLRALSALEGV